MAFGLFESAITSEYEVGLAKQGSVDKLAAAVYDVREKLGSFLFASSSLEEFRDRVAITKNDQSLFRTIEPHLPPVTGTVRRISGKNGILEKEFRTRLAQDGMGSSEPSTTQTPGAAPAMGGGAAVPPLTNNPDPVTPSQSVPPAVGANTLAGSRKTACYPGCEKNEAHAAKFHNKDKEARRRWADASQNGSTPSLLGHPSPPMGGLADLAQGPVGATSGAGGAGQAASPLGDPALKGARRHQAIPGAPAPAAPPMPAPTAGPGSEDDKLHQRPGWEPHIIGDEGFTNPRGEWSTSTLQDSNGNHWGNRRRAELEGTVDNDVTFDPETLPTTKQLKPKGDFKGYLNKVDQGAAGKVKHNFASKEAATIYVDWCRSNDLSPARLSSLDVYAANLSEADYFRLSNTILAWDNEHHPKVPSTELKKKDKVARGPAGQLLSDIYLPSASGTVQDPMRHYVAWCNKNGYKRLSARNINHYARGNPQLAYFLGMRCKEAIRTARRSRRRTAAPDYLQKADDALTQLLNQKAQEFQETIQPLQQALVTVQQAEQLAQQANPLNVLPTPGTVNVMPGQPQSPAAQIGMPDPNQPDISGLVQALQPGGGAMGGVAPQGDTPNGGSGGPPPAAAGGGLPPDMDPGQQQIAASRRHGGGVGDLWDQWQRGRGDLPRGGDVDYEQFQNEKGVGERAINKLKKRNETPDWAGVNGQHAQQRGTTVGRRRRAAWDEESDYTNTDDFHNFNDQGGYKHPGQERGWKGKFDQDQYAPYTGERYTKGDAHVTGGPGPEGGRYYVHTPHGRSGPHGTHDEAFDAAEPFLGQQQEIGQGQGILPLGLPGEQQRAAGVMRNFPKGQRKQAWPGKKKPQAVEPPFEAPGLEGWKFSPHPSGQGYAVQMPNPYGHVSGGDYLTDPSDEFSSGRSQGIGQAHAWPSLDHAVDAALQGDPWGISHGGGGRSRGRQDGGGGRGRGAPPARGRGAPAALPQGRGTPVGRGRGAPTPAVAPKEEQMALFGSKKQAWSGWGPSQFPKTREVTGWKWDDHLNGYTAKRNERFACDCGNSFSTPTGFQRCACGKQWNSYVIGNGGSNKEASADKYLVREIPVRHDVIVANRKLSAVPGWKYKPKPGEQEAADATGVPLPKRSAPAETLTRVVAPWKGDYYPEVGKKAVQLIDPRTGAIHNLIDPGELGEGEDAGTPSMKYPPKDWARRGDGAKWQKSPIGK